MPLAALIPMTTLAAVLLVVAANMADWSSFFRLCKNAPKSDIIVLVATFFLTDSSIWLLPSKSVLSSPPCFS